ncbi:J domain-containing protein [Desulfonema ishimotonii]|uniref:J domain-containing protein n=1 Tax=Desulfonema ishimotonii TaxID=45657 RepID=A0A401FW40_9BACT|nr:J domain-containing protein [Desulfonema ishimotonii]GBC61202.1 J domain-containing protein [Desulfonema ishimotonii]
MYLAQKRIKGRTHYFIRESYADDEVFRSRDLFELGTDPDQYIVYPGGNSYYVRDEVRDRLGEMGIEPDEEEMDDIFWPFLEPDIRRSLDFFRQRSAMSREKKPSAKSGAQFHLFDRRRIHYLRYAQMDQGYIGRVAPKLFNVLCDKSRDEIEQYFIGAERILKQRELKSYIFVIFDLQKHFTESFAKTMPQGLEQNAVDLFFLRDVCVLNDDQKFWTGMEINGNLHDYLIRYVTMFFDHDYGSSTYLDDLVQEWINSHRTYHPPRKKTNVTVKEASTIFGVMESDLRKMSRRELSRLFRRKAQALHPDKGGDSDAFIRLTEAYQNLRERKK